MASREEVAELSRSLFSPARRAAWPVRVAPPGKPHHAGHRQRLRARAAICFQALPDYELLELLLARSLPRGEIKPIAKDLLARFGGLAAVFGAALEELKTIKGVGPATALDLKLVHEATARIGRQEAKKRTVISSWSALLAYVRVVLANEAREQFRVLYLDKKNQLIADEMMNQGTVDHAPVYPREVMRRALEMAASAVILVHNHPSGDPTWYVPFSAGLPNSGRYWRRISMSSFPTTISSVIAWTMSRLCPSDSSGQRAWSVLASESM
jgi:DNA repair protein RadC